MALLAVAGVVLGAWYMLWAAERVLFGGSREPPRAGSRTLHGHDHAPHGHGHDHGHGDPAADLDRCDLRWHEAAALLPLAVFVLWIGLAPNTFLRPAAPALRRTSQAASDAFSLRMHEPSPPGQIATSR